MKKKIVVIAVVIISVLILGGYWAFFDMNRLPKGELISQAESPNGTYTVKAYLSDGGATTSYAVRGELNFNKSKRKPKNIYWAYRLEKAHIEWIDDETVSINGQTLKVPNERYDFRRK